MGKSITIATFISHHEKINIDYFEMVSYLRQKGFTVEPVVFCDVEMDVPCDDCIMYVTPLMTKYRRIEILLKNARYNHLLCIDNDIICNRENIKNFIDQIYEKDIAVAWGKIRSIPYDNLISKLVEVDKILSHNIIRPFLWSNGIGVSVPGQVFYIQRKFYIDKLDNIDTVFDDLTIGVLTRNLNLDVMYVEDILGEEHPKSSFVDLAKQRVRWAQGYYETAANYRNSEGFKYVLIHGFAYHFLWVIYYMLLGMISYYSLSLGCVIFTVTSYYLTNKKIEEIYKGILYSLIFPIFHLVWMVAVIKHFKK